MESYQHRCRVGAESERGRIGGKLGVSVNSTKSSDYSRSFTAFRSDVWILIHATAVLERHGVAVVCTVSSQQEGREPGSEPATVPSYSCLSCVKERDLFYLNASTP